MFPKRWWYWKLQTTSLFYKISFLEIEFAAFRPWRIRFPSHITPRMSMNILRPYRAFCKITQGKGCFTCRLDLYCLEENPISLWRRRLQRLEFYIEKVTSGVQSFLILAVNAKVKVTNLYRAVLRKSIFRRKKRKRSTFAWYHLSRREKTKTILAFCVMRTPKARQHHTSISYDQLSANNAYVLRSQGHSWDTKLYPDFVMNFRNRRQNDAFR